MLFKHTAKLLCSRPRVTPDPNLVAMLNRRFAELTYRPKCGFLRDKRQERVGTHERT
jgi:hypothetical protein